MKKTAYKVIISAVAALFFCFFINSSVAATENNEPFLPQINISYGAEDPDATASTLQILLLVTVLTLVPTLILIMTSFTRIIVALHFLRSALGTQQMPPNQILIGLALVMTLFLMNPAISEINENAYQPYSRGEISMSEALDLGMEPIRRFMLRQVKTEHIALFAGFTGETFAPEETPNHILIPAFVLGEITIGFQFGFMIYMPFIVIDMVVASVLMAMGMMMLPPAMISLPFKILLFVIVDGWGLVIKNLMETFR